MKPYGVGLGVTDGALHFRVQKPTQTEDRIWDAVRTAIEEGWTPTQFIAEARESWQARLKEEATWADDEFKRGKL